MRNTGFIGMGNMGCALAKGLIEYGNVPKDSVYAYAPHQEKLKKNAEEIGFNPCGSLDELLDSSDMLIIACKPYQVDGVLQEAAGRLKGRILLSLAAGLTFKDFGRITDEAAVQCLIPNTPVSVGEGVFLLEKRNNLDSGDRAEIIALLNRTGMVVELDGDLMAAGSAIAGCAPAFVDVFIEALSDGGVKNGLQRQDSYAIICQMIKGAAELAAASGRHPGALKDQVCSPGGTTIRGIAALEENGFRNAVIKAVDATLK